MASSEIEWDHLIPGERQRKRVKEGDVFLMRFEQGNIAGRLVDPRPMRAREDRFYSATRLVYIYRGWLDSFDVPPEEHLLASNLLIAPQLVDRTPWSWGAILVIGNVPLGPGHVLDTFCYRFHTGRDFDHYGYLDKDGATVLLRPKKLQPPPCEPVIEHEITTAFGLETWVSRALGLRTHE